MYSHLVEYDLSATISVTVTRILPDFTTQKNTASSEENETGFFRNARQYLISQRVSGNYRHHFVLMEGLNQTTILDVCPKGVAVL